MHAARLGHRVALSYQDASVEQICPLVDGRGNFDKAYPTFFLKGLSNCILQNKVNSGPVPVGISILN